LFTDIYFIIPKGKKVTGGLHGKIFAPIDHHIFSKDVIASECIQVNPLLLEGFPQPCKDFSGDTSACTCVSDMIREYCLHL